MHPCLDPSLYICSQASVSQDTHITQPTYHLSPLPQGQTCTQCFGVGVGPPKAQAGTISHRYLSHTELAPLRAPLIPMEHCTTRFFETCDLDNDKYIALDEWAGCFGIKERECPS